MCIYIYKYIWYIWYHELIPELLGASSHLVTAQQPLSTSPNVVIYPFYKCVTTLVINKFIIQNNHCYTWYFKITIATYFNPFQHMFKTVMVITYLWYQPLRSVLRPSCLSWSILELSIGDPFHFLLVLNVGNGIGLGEWDWDYCGIIPSFPTTSKTHDPYLNGHLRKP